MVGILLWELVQRKIDENMHWKIILSLLETKFKITKTTVFYKAKLFKQIYVKTIWAKLDAFGLMLVKKKKKKPLPSLMQSFLLDKMRHMKPIKLCVCVCVCVRTHAHVHMRVWLSQYPECNFGLNFKKQYSACFCLHDFTP